MICLAVADNGDNHSLEKAQSIDTLCAVDGTSDGSLSDFRFHALAGQRIAIEIQAQRIGSTMDAVLRLLDASGKPIKTIDDEAVCPDGRFSHTFAVEGDYVLEVFDSRFAAGGRYRLRVGDFPIIDTPLPIAAALGSRVQCSFIGPDAALLPAREVQLPTAYAYKSIPIAAKLAEGKSSAWVPMLLRSEPHFAESASTTALVALHRSAVFSAPPTKSIASQFKARKGKPFASVGRLAVYRFQRCWSCNC